MKTRRRDTEIIGGNFFSNIAHGIGLLTTPIPRTTESIGEKSGMEEKIVV